MTTDFSGRPAVDAHGLVVRGRPAPLPERPATTADALAAGVRHHPEREALVHGDPLHGPTVLTYAGLDARVAAAAGGLTTLGIGPGDRVACSLPNRCALVEAFLATQRLGAVWLGINTNLVADEMAWMLDDADADLLVTTDDRVARAGNRETLVVDPTDGTGSWADLVAAGHPTPTIDVDPQAPAAIAYTSGTTGRPKGAVHSQHNLLWPGISSRRSYPAVPGERHGTALALTILNMLVLGPLWAYLRGTTAVLMDRTDAVGFATEVRTQRINRVTLVPAMAHDLVAHPDVSGDDLATLTQTIIGAGHSPPALRDAWEAKFGTRAIVGYGLTEAPTGVTREHVDQPMRPDGAGYPLEPVRVVVVDDQDRPVPVGDTGEVCLAPTTEGPWAEVWTPMLGYRNQPEATAEALRGGVLHTGDLGFLDEHGQLVIRGRRTEMILRGGANVYPAEVERVVLDHPGVREVTVMGLTDERLGEVVAAGLVAETGPWADGDPDLLVDDVRSFCRNRLARYKVPDRMLVLDDLPRNAMGKVVRSELARSFE
jgi:acyl-CoA synthetase (AMP-forming)/AMP-acid ligase II